MQRRIALWALAGFIVACGLPLTAALTGPWTASNRALWAVVDVLAPASLLRAFPLKYYWFILLNAGTYAVLGLGVELLRRKFHLQPHPLSR